MGNVALKEDKTMDATIKKLIEMHREMAERYRQLANEACSDHNPFEVYDHIKSSIAEEGKARRLKMQFGREEF